LPKLLNAAEPKRPPITATVIPNADPPLRMVVPSARTSVGSPGSGCDGFRRWGLRLGGADAGETTFKLIVQSETDDPVYIAGVRAVVSRVRPIRSPVVVVCPSQGEAPEREVLIDLDTSQAGRYVRAGRQEPFNFVLSRGKSEIFRITAATKRHAVHWVLEVDVVVAGKHRTMRLDDNGRAFATSGYARRVPEYFWDFEHQWFPSGVRDVPVPVGRRLPPRGAL
jgi:hypothetical protein